MLIARQRSERAAQVAAAETLALRTFKNEGAQQRLTHSWLCRGFTIYFEAQFSLTRAQNEPGRVLGATGLSPGVFNLSGLNSCSIY